MVKTQSIYTDYIYMYFLCPGVRLCDTIYFMSSFHNDILNVYANIYLRTQ